MLLLPAGHADVVDSTIWHEIAPGKGEVVIPKSSYGAFYDTPPETIFEEHEPDTVFICGTTAQQAYERSFKVVFSNDVNATDDPAMQEPELKTLRKGLAKVTSCDEIIRSLQ